MLQHRVAQCERERDQAQADTADMRLRHARATVRLFTLESEYHSAIADVTDLRLRHGRLATRFYTMEAEYRAAPQVADREAALERQLEQLRGAERQQQALEQELVRLRSTLAAWIPMMAPPAPSSIPRPPSSPWYRRFWFGLIGKDVRAAEWTASQHSH
jgi:chromosome segregation ATPase